MGDSGLARTGLGRRTAKHCDPQPAISSDRKQPRDGHLRPHLPRIFGALASLLILATALPVVASAAECTDTWIGPAEGTWQTAVNWSALHVPTSSDVACIGSGKKVKVTEGTNQVAVVQGEGTLAISGGSLELTRSPSEEVSNVTFLTVSGGTLTGVGKLNISGSLTWTGGTMSGTGSTVVSSGATGSISGGVTQTERTLVNNGTLTFSANFITMRSGATLENAGTFNANSEGAGIGPEGTGTAPKIINTGTFQKTQGTGETKIETNFENRATLKTTTGTLGFLRSTSTATLVNGSVLEGGITFRGPTVIAEGFTSSNGTLKVTAGSLTIGSGYTAKVTNLTASSTIGGAGTIEVSGSLTWTGGTMSGTGSTVVSSGATGSISGGVTQTERTLVNNGTLTFSANFITMRSGATLENAGTFNANSEGAGIGPEGTGTAPKIINTGTFQKTQGTGETKIETNFENRATLKTTTGTLGFLRSTSTVTLVNGSVLEGGIAFRGQVVTAQGFTSSSGTLTVSAGSLSIEGGYTAKISSLNLTSTGTLKGAGTAEVSASLTWTGGTMSGIGSTVVSSAATGSISGGVTQTERTLVNNGTLTYSANWISMRNGATLENAGTFNANAEGGAAIGPEGTGAAPKIINTGTFKKTQGTGETVVETNFENKGTIGGETGTLDFARKGGSLTLVSSSVLKGSIKLKYLTATGADLAAQAGSLTMREASLSLTGTSNLRNLIVEYGSTLTGSGNIAVEQSFSWGGQSTLSGTGSIVLMPGTTNVLNSGATTVTLAERTLTNEGTFTQTSDSRLNENAGAVLRNKGTYNLNAEPYPLWVTQMILNEGGGSGTFVNSGVFQRTEGTTNVVVTPDFENLSVIKEQSSKVNIEHPKTVPTSNEFGKHCKEVDPVDCATGNFSESQTDFAIGGRGVGLFLMRTYSAQAAAKAVSPGAFGYGWTNSFSDHLLVEEEGKKITVVQGSGSTETFTESGGSWRPPTWSQDELAGNGEAGYTLTRPEQTQLHFSPAGRLETVTDRNGNQTTLGYDETGRLKTITDPAERQITLTYNGGGQVESAKDPMGHVVKYGYESGKLASVTMPGETSPRWQFKYDASRRITEMTDGRGGVTKNEYDSSNRVISQTDPAKRTTTFEYAAFHTKITNKATGAVTDEWFTSNNEPFSITHGYGTSAAATQTFSYNEAGQLISVTDGNGHTTTYGYDANGNKTSEKDAAGDETKWTYNETHDVVSITKPGGEKTTIARDAHGNAETVSRPGPGETTQTTTYKYGAHGELESTTDPLEHTWSFEYDGYGDLKAEIDPEGDKRTWAYDEDSRLTSMVSPRGNEEGAEASKFTTSIEHDAQGRPVKVTDPLEGTTKYAYDANGNIESEADPNGHKTTFIYDADNEPTKVEKPNGNILKTGYDGAGQVTSQTDGSEHTTTYVRNVLEEPVEVIDPLERKTTQEYDAAGNLKSITDPLERKASYTYDTANRLTKISYSEEATPSVTVEYDADGNLTSMSDGTGESTFTYDQLDRLIEAKDGHGSLVSYEYNLGNEQTGITYPNGKGISRTFDKAGRLASVTDWLKGTTSFAYDSDSNMASITFPEGTGNVDEYAYDRADAMSEAKMKKGTETLAALAYTRDKVDQLESLTSKGLPGTEEESFGYDENNRLTKAGAGSYSYDAADNLTKAPGTENSYDKASELEKATSATLSYDKKGERTKLTPTEGPATTYKYDQAGRLTAVERAKEGEVPAISESYAYDGIGLRASQTVSGTTSYLTWDASASLPTILSDGQNSYLYGPEGLPFEEVSSEETPTYLHHDQLGSTRLLTNSSGEAVGTFTYGAYGALSASTGTQTTPLGFAGQYTDAQSGLIYMRARMYDPATGQFLTRDPLEMLSGQPYAYAFDNPVNATDPSGRFATTAAGCAIGEVADPAGGCVAGAAAATAATAAAAAAGAALGSLTSDHEVLGNLTISKGLTAQLAEANKERSESDSEKGCEIGDRRQAMEKAQREVAQEEFSRGSNPNAPFGNGPRWTQAAALIARLITAMLHHGGR
jgi:RHS repeat-associated protein